ncbi:sperm microtubule associated protein 2 isoform X4 [Aotus nancymaae]|uniref:sperm microtubule associated protein 2 isoform X4 n=1 Tax=Aotus nancymaae TaxID=37293 RepID=UPI0030FE694B
MGNARRGRGSLGSQHSGAGGGSEKEPDGDPRGLRSSVYGSRRVTDPRLQDLGHAELGPEDPEEELRPEEGAGEELPETLDPKDDLSELERALDLDAEEDIPEMSRLSISQKIPGPAVARARKKRRRRRPRELAEPKRHGQVLKDRGQLATATHRDSLGTLPSGWWPEESEASGSKRETRGEGSGGPACLLAGRAAVVGATPGFPHARRACTSVSTGRLCTGPSGSWRTPASPSQCPRCPGEWRSCLGPGDSTWNIIATGVPGIQGGPNGSPQLPDPPAVKAEGPGHPAGRVGPHAETQATCVRL